MKLQYTYEHDYNTKIILLYFLLFDIIVNVLVFGIGIYFKEKILTLLFFSILLFLIIMIFFLIFLFLAWISNIFIKKRNQKIKQNGHKLIAEIKYTLQKYHYRSFNTYALIIQYNLEQFTVDNIQNNQAFKFITDYCNKPNHKKIPITIYKYQNKIFADLNSVSFENLTIDKKS